MLSYSYANVKSAVNARIHGKIGMLIDPRSTINNAVKELWSLVDLRSAKRRTLLAPNLFQNVYQYNCPVDCQNNGLVDIQRQTDDRPRQEEWTLTTDSEFDRYKLDISRRLVAFSDHDLIRKLLITAPIDDQSLIVSSLDSITAAGTWAALGDGTNVRTDSQNFVKGNGSVEFDMNSGGTTAGITSANVTTFDLTNYVANGSIFVWAYVVTADANLTGVTLKIGSSSGNYYTRTVTTTNEGTALQVGWNLLRFDLNGISQVGTVVNTAGSYVALYFNKLVGKSSETSYRFDHIMAKNGKFYNLLYYSQYPWQTAAGAYIPDSTVDTDVLNVGAEEYQLILEKCIEMCAYEAREANDASIAINRLGAPLGSVPAKPGQISNYQLSNPSEALILTTTYHDFASIDGDFNQFGSQR